MMMFDGFRSRRMTPRWWAWLTAVLMGCESAELLFRKP